MNTGKSSHDPLHLLGESATHPIEPRYGALAALFLLAAMRPQRRRARARRPWPSPGTNSPQDCLCLGSALPAHRIEYQRLESLRPELQTALPSIAQIEQELGSDPAAGDSNAA